MLRRAYVRGVTKALLDTGAIKVANEETATELADAVADEIPEQPVGEVAPEATAEIAATLMDLAQNLDSASQNAAAAAEAAAGGAAPEAPKEASMKRAAAFLRRKFAEEPGRTGNTITGTQPGQLNTPQQGSTGEGKMDNTSRPPESYANFGEAGVGSQPQLGEGSIGKEKKVEGTGMGDVAKEQANEVNKTSSVQRLVRQALTKRAQGTGTLITGSDPSQFNTPQQAAQVDPLAALDQAQRPEGYAVMGVQGVGQSAMAPSLAAAAIGQEQKPDASMGAVAQDGTNTVIEQSKMGEEKAYLQQFKQTSAKYASALPFWMSQNEKVAAIQYLMSLSPAQRQGVMSQVSKTAELPEGLKAYVEGKKEEGGEEKKDEEKKDEEKKDEEKKEEKKEATVRAGDIISRLRGLSR